MVRFDRARLLDPAIPAATRERRAVALALAEAGLRAIDPYTATRRALERLGPEALEGATIFALGKASVAMSRAALDAARDADVAIAGGIVLALAPSGATGSGRAQTLDPGSFETPRTMAGVVAALPGLRVIAAGHPAPAPDAESTGRAVLAAAEALGPRDRALCLVSGGGSAMLELPRDGVRLDELRAISAALMRAGADIEALNAVRTKLSHIKGGGLAAAIAPASLATVILSDVPGRPLSWVASGPTLAPPSSPDPEEVLRRFGVSLSASARAAMAAGGAPAEPDGQVELAADGDTARRAIVEAAARLGLRLRDRPGHFAGEARALGRAVAPGAYVWGGETTVTVRGCGRGGRSQELALAALTAGWPAGALLAFGTDGVDGTSDAAGALIDPLAVRDARRRRLDPADALANNDAHRFFTRLGTALVTGPTGTNVADLLLCIP